MTAPAAPDAMDPGVLALYGIAGLTLMREARASARLDGDTHVVGYDDPLVRAYRLTGRCRNCGNQIHVMAFKGTGWCSEVCRKRLAGEIA